MVRVSVLNKIPNDSIAIYCGNHTPAGRKTNESEGEYIERIESLLVSKSQELRDFLNELYKRAKSDEVYICTPSNQDPSHLNYIANMVNRKLREPNKKGLWFSGSYATFCLQYDDNSMVVDAPPIAKWTIGKKCDQVVAWYQGKGFEVKMMR